jgi:hypothetical protein
VVQGDPLSGWLFNLTVSTALRPVRAKYSPLGVVIATLHDDIFIIGPPDAAFDAANDVKEALTPLRLVLNPAKAAAYAADMSAELTTRAHAAGIPVRTDGIVVGGAPVGTFAFEHDKVAEAAAATRKKLHDIRDAHTTIRMPNGIPALQGLTRVLRMCIPSRMTYLLRTVSPAITRPICAALDKDIYSAFMRMLGFLDGDPLVDPGTPTGALAYARVAMPIAMGGSGITPTNTSAAAAYLASLSLTGEHIQTLAPTLFPDPAAPADPPAGAPADALADAPGGAAAAAAAATTAIARVAPA